MRWELSKKVSNGVKVYELIMYSLWKLIAALPYSNNIKEIIVKK